VKQLIRTGRNRIFLLKAALLAAMFLPAFGLPVYAQQEVDPTWYDPWAAQTNVVVQPAKSRTHKQESRQSTTAVPPGQHAQRTRPKPSRGQRQAGVGTGHSHVK
jgi:hypothetical protein